MTKDELKNISVEKQEGSAVKITGEIPFEHLAKHREAAVKHLGKDIEIDGFRKGNIPEKVLIERVGEMPLLEEMANRALQSIYPLIIDEHEIDVIGYPQISLTKLAMDNPLGFTAVVATVPEITLPDYKKIAAEINKDKESPEVTDEDVENQIKDILRQKYERLQKKAEQAKEGAEAPADEPEGEVKDDELPELTDEVVKTLGQPGQFENVEDFKAKIKEHLEIQKKQEVESAHRAKITDAIVEKTEMELPKVLIDAEIAQMFGQMEQDLTRAGLKIDDYLSHMKKTREDLVKEWTPSAEKRAKLQLVLNEIAKVEETKPDETELKNQTDALIAQYKDADENRVRTYVASVLTNEAVMKMLESQ
jgi:trigger factor